MLEAPRRASLRSTTGNYRERMMTSKSDGEQAKYDWVKWKPSKKKCELTPHEREDFETAIYRSHEGLVKKWIRQFVPEWLLEPIDAAQLKIDVLDKLTTAIWKKFEGEAEEKGDMNANGARLLCWTITKRRSIDALRMEDSLKRSIPGEPIPLSEIGDLPDRNDSNRPDRKAELKDLESVIANALEPKKRRSLELKQMKWTNKQIAKEVGVSISTLNAMQKKIAETAQRIINKPELSIIKDVSPPDNDLPTASNGQRTTDNGQFI